MSYGKYIVLEGPDGCGKSTQYNLLGNRLSEKFEVLRIREPGGTLLGDQIRSLLLDPANEEMSAKTELFLFSACRSHLIEKLILPALREGKIVLSDRNCYSSEAYQGAGGKIELETILYCNQLATSGLTPDLAIILDIDHETGLKRARRESSIKDKIESRATDYHKRVQEAYRTIAKRDSDICVLVDASRSIEEIHEEVYSIAMNRIKDPFKH